MTIVSVTRQFKAFLAQEGITQAEVARKSGYNRTYLSALLQKDTLNYGQRMKLLEAYPEARDILTPDFLLMSE